MQPERVPETGSRAVPLDWSGVTSIPVLAANQLLVQVDLVEGQPDAILITIGHASPPPIVGTPEEQAAQLETFGSVAVSPLARVSVSKGRLAEWVGLLSHTLEHVNALPPEGGA